MAEPYGKTTLETVVIYANQLLNQKMTDGSSWENPVLLTREDEDELNDAIKEAQNLLTKQQFELGGANKLYEKVRAVYARRGADRY